MSGQPGPGQFGLIRGVDPDPSVAQGVLHCFSALRALHFKHPQNHPRNALYPELRATATNAGASGRMNFFGEP